MRDMVTNRNLSLKDDYLKATQQEKREKSHNKTIPLAISYDTGDTVMIKDQLTKTKPREKFIIV